MALRYIIPFTSRKGKTCRIDIYDSTYSGDSTVISPANVSTPGYAAQNVVEIQEADDDNLLNVLRPKTGYINLIEKTYGSLQDLFPMTNTQNQVYVYYDGVLVFFGYMQAQAFENEWKAVPRELKFPIFSPLAVMDGMTFDDDPYLTDTMIGEYMDTCLSAYDDVILPRDLISDSDVTTPMQLRINSRIVSPFNEDYNYGVPLYGVAKKLYNPITYQAFLQAFCNLYGLVAHEFGKTIIFSKFDYSGQYVKMLVGDLQDDTMDTTGMPTGATVLPIENYFSLASANGREGLVMPINDLTYKYGSYVDSIPMDLSRSKYRGRVALTFYETETLAILEPQTREFSSSLFTTDGGELTNRNHVRVLGNGSAEKVEMFWNGADSTTPIFAYTFTSVPSNIDGATFKTTFKHEEGEADKKLRMTVYSGGKYLDANHDWHSSPSYLELTFGQNGECTTYDVASNGRYVTITIYPDTTDPTIHGMIESLTLETFADPLRKYEIPTDNEKVVKNTTPGMDSETVDMLFQSAVGNGSRVEGGIVPLNTYAYLFAAQVRHVRDVMPAAATDMATIYAKLISSTEFSGYFRLIAASFTPWDDVYTLTLHKSETLD